MLLLIVSLITFTSVLQLDAEPVAADFVGCISQIPNDGLRLGVSSSGISYLLEGSQTALLQHLNQLVRIRGQAKASNSGNPSLPLLSVYSVAVIADTCAAAIPASQPQAVVGKAGEGQVAIPVTTTASADQTTPGFQTETIDEQEPPTNGRSSSGPRSSSLVIPRETAQAAQSAAAADTYAQSATRSEIQPGNSLGTSTLLASSGFERTASGAKPVLVELRGAEKQEFSPAMVTIRVGQVVQWRNASSQVHEIVANPAKTMQSSKAALPANTKPFDSGFLEPGATFSYSFVTPGVYRYFCSLNCSRTPVGEVLVRR